MTGTLRSYLIEALSARGEGLAGSGADRESIAFALPGETVLARPGIDGRLVLEEVKNPSLQRVSAICPHFTRCGGCAMQHAAPDLYASWKTGLIATALQHRGIAAEIAPLIDAHGAGRRRITLHVRREPGEKTSTAGFMAARSHSLVGLDSCPLTVDSLRSAPAAARRLGDLLAAKAKPLDIQFTATENGLDADIRGAGPLGAALTALLADEARALGIARLSNHGEVICELAPPVVHFGRALVKLPPGSFLQPTAAGEETLARLALAGLAKCRRIADLFAGAGPFTFRAAETAAVYAADASAAAIAALGTAARNIPGLKPITAETRDLFRKPLLARELAAYDGVILDPPRAGAEAQCHELARSTVSRIAYVSCDAASFARDCAILAASGRYRIEGMVQPVDQFRHAAHLETVAIFALSRGA